MDKQRKQPTEERTYNFDFTNKLIEGRALASCLPIVQSVYYKPKSITGTPTPLDIGALSISSPFAQVRIGSGQHLVIYKLTAVGTDDEGDVVEVDGLLEVKEV